MSDIDDTLRELADAPEDYQREGGLVLFSRHGKEETLTLVDIPGAGTAVEGPGEGGYLPIAAYVQARILDLPRLARQIGKALEKLWEARPLRYVEGPARSREEVWQEAGPKMRECLTRAESGTTHLVQLMGKAGEGKTALLEHLAMQFAGAYHPDPFPSPILLPVDLLGRYVGTVDDAIAGALNNTFLFPGLSQRDVALCIKRRWMILALDGFDELVARVGARDAFLRVNELLEQLDRSGTVVLSARESFFELYQITSAIRSYLDPRRGAYTTTLVELQPWGRKQGVQVFARLASPQPDRDISDLLTAFGGDESLVFQPFFLTRLAQLWRQGERFSGVERLPDELGRIKFIIETFVAREAREKWIGRDSRPLLDVEEHGHFLGFIAEEMWGAGAFLLSTEELRIATAVALEERSVARDVIDEAVKKVPTHAALMVRSGRYAFLHDHFLAYFLGLRISGALAGREVSLQRILAARDLSNECVEWVIWNCRGRSIPAADVLAALADSIRRQPGDQTLADNVGRLCGRVLSGRSDAESLTVRGFTFVGESLAGVDFENVIFDACGFWQADLSKAKFTDCSFAQCRFGDIHTDGATSFAGSVFRECEVRSLDVRGERTYFAPEEIASILQRAGAKVDVAAAPAPPVPPQVRTREDVVECVGRFVRASQRTTIVAVEDMEEQCGALAKAVSRSGLESGVLREDVRSAAGPRKTFVRFEVDRSLLLRGGTERTRNAQIDAFWDELRRRYPARG